MDNKSNNTITTQTTSASSHHVLTKAEQFYRDIGIAFGHKATLPLIGVAVGTAASIAVIGTRVCIHLL